MAIKYTPEALPEPQRINLNVGAFYGLNRTGAAQEGEFVSCKNMSSDKFPYASPCMPKEVIKSGLIYPKHVLFCGDKLSYIASGILYVQSGNSFSKKGYVGAVMSYTEFSDTKTLFFPSNYEYDSKNDKLIQFTSYLDTAKGYYQQDGTYVDVTGWTVAQETNTIPMYYLNSHYDYYYVAPIAIKGANGKNKIFATPKKDSDGNIKQESGKTVYYPITVNIENSCALVNGSSNSTTNVNLYYQAFDESGNLLTPPTDSAGGIYTTDFKKGDFGTPIPCNYNGTYAASYILQIGYSRVSTSNSKNRICAERQILDRNTDYNNSNFHMWIETGVYPAPNSRPKIYYACTDNNRVAGVYQNNFYASCLGDYTNWVDFVDADGNPKETGAYAEELNTAGDFTGCVKYAGNVVLTKADMIYLCYGNKPPYRIVEIAKIGCIDGRSIAECGGYLYFLGRDGIYRFSGGVPVLISQKLDRNFVSGCGVSAGKKYYCCAYDGERHELYCLDTERGTWHVEDGREYISFAAHGNELYGLTAQGEIIKFNSGSDAVKWEFTTKQFDFDTDYTKNLAKVYCRLKLYGQAWTDIYIRSSKTDWHKFANIKANGENVIQAKCKVKKCDFIQLKFCGKGQCEIMDIYADITVGTKKHRAGKNLTVFRK